MIAIPQKNQTISTEISAAQKEIELRRLMRDMRPVLVAYSGGVDSSYLAFIANLELGDDAQIVMGVSASVSAFQKKEAAAAACSGDFSYREVETRELEDESYSANPTNRCYFCKSELYDRLSSIAKQEHARWVLDGTNADDLSDHRPGREAAAERSVRSPLAELGFTKADIRERSKIHGLISWDKPASPCLSSRIAHGVPVTIGRLSQVEAGENLLRREGFREFRVRVHDELVRIEISRNEIEKALDRKLIDRLQASFKALGFKYVTLDLEGFRSGSLNQSIPVWPKVENHQIEKLEKI